MKQILIADDESRMRKLVSDLLKKEGFKTTEAKDGGEALKRFHENPQINLVILDVMMPVYDGWSVCREIRKVSRVPIIMLTARGEEPDELFGFKLGADEYIKKPFSLQILTARVHALLNRKSRESEETLEVGGIVINKTAHTVSIDSIPMELSPKEYELLSYLLKNRGRALSRDQILQAVWDYNYFEDTRTVDTHIKKLRLKLGKKRILIQTVYGFGYRFEVCE